MELAEQEKQSAARASLRYVENNMRVGLGTGSTVKYLLEELALQCKRGLQIRCVPTSIETEQKTRMLGIPLATLEELPSLDIAIDGTDQFDKDKNLIKGGHGALLREKVVAAAAERFIVLADSSKRADVLHRAVPVEVIPFAVPVAKRFLSELGGEPKLRVDKAGKTFMTDQGNHILDVSFGKIASPAELANRISVIPGVAGHGLFCGMAHVILVGQGSGVDVVE